MSNTRRNRRRRLIQKTLDRRLAGPPLRRPKKMKLNGFSEYNKQPINLLYPWGAIFVQGGSNGIVFQHNGPAYRTAYFEAFPKMFFLPRRFKSASGEPFNLKWADNIGLFIRGEGPTIRHAEVSCRLKLNRIRNGHRHVMDRLDRTDGYAYCKRCSFSETMFDPTTKCHVCGEKTNWQMENFVVNGKVEERWFCEEHKFSDTTDPTLSESSKRHLERMNEMEEWRKNPLKAEDISAALNALSESMKS